MTDRYVLKGMDMTVLECGSCGVRHAIPTTMHEKCMEEGGYWHCPNGHSRGYKEGRRTTEAKERERERLKQENARLQDAIVTAERAKERVKADLKRHQRRAAAGTCPCCQRTFNNMARHMKTKHPDYNVVPINAKA